MEFGLQSRGSQSGSPAIIGNPRKRIEAKSYRARDRMDNGWFKDDSGRKTQELSKENCNCCNKCGIALLSSSPPKTPGARQPLALTPKSLPRMNTPRNRTVGQYQKQSALQTRSVGPKIAPITDTRSPSRARMHRELFPNCKDWFRHEHTIIVSDDSDDDDSHGKDEQKQYKDQRRAPQKGFLSPSWWPNDDNRQKSSGCSPSASPRSRVVSADAERYWQRNHDGSAKDWYPHEHPEDLLVAAADECSIEDDKEVENIGSEQEESSVEQQLCCKCQCTAALSAKEAVKRQLGDNYSRSHVVLAKKFLAA